jgi:hypothetical protein
MPDEPDEPFFAEHIHDALSREPRVRAPELHVTVEHGRARVEGTVATLARKEAIAVVVAEGWPDLEIDDHTTVADFEHDGRIEVV